MVANKKFHCVICNKKCSGNVLRYQNQYYHKQCFEVSQNDEKRQDLYADNSMTPQSDDPIYNDDSQSQIRIMTTNQTSSKDSHINTHQQYSDQVRNQSTAKSRVDSHKQAGRSSSQHHFGSDSGNPSVSLPEVRSNGNIDTMTLNNHARSQTIDARGRNNQDLFQMVGPRSATLSHSASSPLNGFQKTPTRQFTNCAGCKETIKDGQALIALDLHWHVWCFKCTKCQAPLHGEYVAKDGKAYCEKDYQKLFGVTCVYCKRYITGKVLQAGEAHHFHPSCARCSKCGDPFVPGEEMYLQGEVTWHPRCGPGPESGTIDEMMLAESSNRSQLRASRAQSPSLSSRSRSRSASPFSFLSRQYGRASPGYADSEAVGDLSRIYTISYLNDDPTQGYLRRPIEPSAPKSPQFTRPASSIRGSSRSSSRLNQHYSRDRSVPRGMYSVLSSMRSGSSQRARSPSMMNEEAIHLAQYPSGQKPSPDSIPKIERDDFPAPPFPYPDRVRSSSQIGSRSERSQDDEHPTERRQEKKQERASRPRSREIVITASTEEDSSSADDPQLKKEEEELSKIANGIGKIFLQTLKEREKLRAWKRANLDPRNASRTPSATRELPSRLRYDNPTNASPSRDMDRPRPWEEEEELRQQQEHSPTRTRSSLGKPSQMSSTAYGYKVVQSNRSTPKPGYGVSNGTLENPYNGVSEISHKPLSSNEMSFDQQQRGNQNRSNDLLSRATLQSDIGKTAGYQQHHLRPLGSTSAQLRRSMPNVNNLHHLHQEGPPKLYPYHLLATSNYRLPPDVDRCHLERHLANDEFQYLFHCDRLDFYRLPEWKRNELKRRAKLF